MIAWMDENGGITRLQDGGAQTIAVLPGQSVRRIAETLPALRGRERAQAAQFAVEPHIGTTIEAAHIVAGEDRILIVEHGVMETALTALSNAGIDADAIHADFEVVRGHTARLDDRIILPGQFTLDADWPVDGEVVETTPEALTIDTTGAVNLRTGDYAPRRGLYIERGHISRAAALIALIGVSWLILQVASTRSLSSQAEALRAQASDIYANATGQVSETPARDIARLVSGNAGPAVDGADLSGVVFAALADVPGTSVDTLQYDAGTRQLSLRLVYPAFETATALERAVASRGARFQAGGVREISDQLIGEAVVTLNGAG